MKFGFSQQMFGKHKNIKFYEHLASGNRVIPSGRTERHGEADSGFWAILRRRLKILNSVHGIHLRVVHESENKQRLFPYTALTIIGFITLTESVYCAV